MNRRGFLGTLLAAATTRTPAVVNPPPLPATETLLLPPLTWLCSGVVVPTSTPDLSIPINPPLLAPLAVPVEFNGKTAAKVVIG